MNGPKYVFGDFNARIGHTKPVEDQVFGQFGFGREAVHAVEMPRRELLLEFCSGLQYTVGNMCMQTPDSQKVTF